MAIYETFSKRQKKLIRQGVPDPYRYDDFPKSLRVQVVNLLNSVIGEYYYYDSCGDRYTNSDAAAGWNYIHETLAHEYGVFELASGANTKEKCIKFITQAEEVETCLDFVEVSFRVIQRYAEHYSEQGKYKTKKQCEDAIQELNYRLREHSLGYQFEEGMIIRVDSQYIHAEVVKPTLLLLHDIEFDGASEEFLQAHEHYRAKRYAEAIVGALKAFESTMKGICDARNWKYADNVTAKGLIDLIFSKELIPPLLSSQFSGLRSVLESGLPTVRNKQGGHGQGKDSFPIPSHMAAYALHLAASNIVMLLEAHKALK
jgi:hypothetical protein